MACFMVPAAEAVITTIAAKSMESKERACESHASGNENADLEMNARVPFSKKVKWLNNLLWGGSALLAFEHVWHGEIIPSFPFLSAASDPAAAAEMLHEMGTVGVTMAALITIVWGGMVAVSSVIEKRALSAQTDK